MPVKHQNVALDYIGKRGSAINVGRRERVQYAREILQKEVQRNYLIDDISYIWDLNIFITFCYKYYFYFIDIVNGHGHTFIYLWTYHVLFYFFMSMILNFFICFYYYLLTFFFTSIFLSYTFCQLVFYRKFPILINQIKAFQFYNFILIFFYFLGFASCGHWRKLWDKKSFFYGIHRA